MIPEDIPFKPLAELCEREGYRLIIKEGNLYGIQSKTGWGDAQFGRAVREILKDKTIDNSMAMGLIIEEFRK